MQQIIKNLFVGNQTDEPGEGWATINAAKNPWHLDAVGYTGNLDPTHPDYLLKLEEDFLHLNMIDPPFALVPKFTDPMMKAAFKFINDNIGSRPVLVRCNQGFSRSPSIILAYLANTDQMVRSNYAQSSEMFTEYMYNNYAPGKGVAAYLTSNWDAIMKL